VFASSGLDRPDSNGFKYGCFGYLRELSVRHEIFGVCVKRGAATRVTLERGPLMLEKDAGQRVRAAVMWNVELDITLRACREQDL